MADAVLPDSVPLVINVLANHALLTGFSGPRVSAVIQEDWTGYCMRVVRVAGTLLTHYADSPRLQLDLWGPLTDAGGAGTADFALHAAAAIPDLAGQHGSAWIANVDIADGPVPEADDNGRPRVRIDVTFEIYNH